MVEIEDNVLNEILFELKSLKKEIKLIKKELKEEDLSSFVNSLEENNLLSTSSEARKVGLKL